MLMLGRKKWVNARMVERGGWSALDAVEHGGENMQEPKKLSVSFTHELLHTRGMKLHWTESKYIVDDDDFEDIK